MKEEMENHLDDDFETIDTPTPEAKPLNSKRNFLSIFRTNHRISDSFINVLTVSFGVLLAAYINHLVQNNKEQNEADQFLVGLYSDLESDHAELINDLNSFKKSSKGFTYYYQIESKEEFVKDSIRKHQNFIYNYVLLFPNIGRFEGFKSSGKIYYIENEELRNEILNFYQETTPVLIGVSNYYNSQSERLRIYIEEVDTEMGIEELLVEPKGKIILQKCMSLQLAIIKLYEDAILKTEKIMSLIKDEQNIQ